MHNYHETGVERWFHDIQSIHELCKEIKGNTESSRFLSSTLDFTIWSHISIQEAFRTTQQNTDDGTNDSLKQLRWDMDLPVHTSKYESSKHALYVVFASASSREQAFSLFSGLQESAGAITMNQKPWTAQNQVSHADWPVYIVESIMPVTVKTPPTIAHTPWKEEMD